MTVREIVKEYLREHGFNGLCSEDGECGCGIDDLFPCGDVSGCTAVHRAPFHGPGICDLGGGCEYHIRPGSEKTK